ncbi:nitroreductase family protein [Neorhodopirellula lusitana]|nr:nitroreductase [Neorhodopirellula lusitana]
MHSESNTSLIRLRRSIKPAQLSDRPVSDKILREIIENATWAPTHGMTEPWRFTVYQGAARKRLADFLASTYKSITPPEQFKPNKYEALGKSPLFGPVVIAVGMERQESEKISELDEVMAVACAVQNMHLTCASHGLGGFWSTNVAATSDAMRDFTGLKPKDRSLGLFYIGYPNCEWPTSQRQPADEKIQWVHE